MSAQKIIKIFDANPNMTLRQLSNITGKTVQELKTILMA
jgi:hypothetical protein